MIQKTIVLAISLLVAVHIYAQDFTKQAEVGLSFSNLNAYGLTYRFGNDRSLWRVNSSLIDLQAYEEKNTHNTAEVKKIDVLASFGKEFRKKITNKLSFRYGLDASMEYRHSRIEYLSELNADNNNLRKEESYIPGLNLICGLLVEYKKHFIIGFELLPGASYTMTKQDQESKHWPTVSRETNNLEANLSNNSALLSFCYKW